MTVITLNGEQRDLGDAATIETAVRAIGTLDGRGVAVALDGEVVPRGQWATTEVREGQQVEVLHAVQGGA